MQEKIVGVIFATVAFIRNQEMDASETPAQFR